VLDPSLKVFSWDFNTIARDPEPVWYDFGDSEGNWLRELAKFAVSHKAALEKIEIRFDTEDFIGSDEEFEYPWDRMDNVRDEILRPNGRDLMYNEPYISRGEWLGQFIETEECESDSDEAIV
jgi:hypothetical protein